MALRSKTGISRGTSDEDERDAGLLWAEEKKAMVSKVRTQRMGVRILASVIHTRPKSAFVSSSHAGELKLCIPMACVWRRSIGIVPGYPQVYPLYSHEIAIRDGPGVAGTLGYFSSDTDFEMRSWHLKLYKSRVVQT